MASLRNRRATSERNGWDDVQSWINMAGASFPVHQTGLENAAPLPSGDDFSAIYKSNGIVFACMAARQRVFSQVTFRYAALNNGRIGRLFGGPALDILSKPWPGGTTRDLATRMISDADNKGAFYAVQHAGRIYPRDPLKTSIVLSGDPAQDEFVDILGYVYQPNGERGPAYPYLPDEVCHWTPTIDPSVTAYAKGMSWLTPVLREIRSDNAATDHKARFYANAATPNMVVKFPADVMSQEQFDRFKAKMEAEYSGVRNGSKTMYLAPGADVEVVGTDFSKLDFSNTQGRDETRIASAAGVPAVIVGLKESLAGSSLNAGNYDAARRSFADGTMTDLYGGAADALSVIAPAPQLRGPSRLWFDISQVPFFREDRNDAATIRQTQAATIKSLIDAGYQPDSVIAAMEAEDFGLLVHSGLYSVQLQKPGSDNGGIA